MRVMGYFSPTLYFTPHMGDPEISIKIYHSFLLEYQVYNSRNNITFAILLAQFIFES